MITALVVDDEPAALDGVVRALRIEGYRDVVAVSDPREALRSLDDITFDVALLDINMPQMNGLELLEAIKERSPETECIMLTANESIPTVIQAIKRGAYDYLLKPMRPDQLMQSIERALERKRLVETLMIRSRDDAPPELRDPEAFREIVANDAEMLKLLHEAELHASSRIPVLITGETGVGKELLARGIHRASPRAHKPFVAVNMLSLSMSLFESEFFGHVKGAFTGAEHDHKGYLAQAKGGTLFLDEIGDLPPEIQGKLLRILQEDEFTPVGRTRPEKAAVRFVAATNQDLPKLVEERRFRADLFYRLQFAHLRIPPLRQRLDDLPPLSAKLLAETERPGVTLTDEALRLLYRHRWPGNVRELRGVLEAAANLAEGGPIEAEHIRLPQVGSPRGESAPAEPSSPRPEEEDDATLPLAEVERRHILTTYRAMGCNKTQTARALGIGLQTLHRKLKKYRVD